MTSVTGFAGLRYISGLWALDPVRSRIRLSRLLRKRHPEAVLTRSIGLLAELSVS